MYKQKFVIDSSTNLKDDPCAIAQFNEANREQANYNFAPYLGWNCPREKYFVATERPAVFQTGNFCGFPTAVDAGSNLRNGKYGNIAIGQRKTDAKYDSRTKYQTPPATPYYIGPPNMAVGQNVINNPDVLSDMYNGELTHDKCSLRGVSYDRFIPLIPEIKDYIHDVNHYVETYWVRGGMDTRTIIRNIDYLKTCGMKR